MNGNSNSICVAQISNRFDIACDRNHGQSEQANLINEHFKWLFVTFELV